MASTDERPSVSQQSDEREYDRRLAEALAALLVAEHRRRVEQNRPKTRSDNREDAA